MIPIAVLSNYRGIILNLSFNAYKKKVRSIERQRTSGMDSSSSSSFVPNSCPICLGPFVQESYLDQCFHKFCYNCILRWKKVVSCSNSKEPNTLKCPLCKRESFSIIHGYNGCSFQQHYINNDSANSSFFSKGHKYRLQCYYIDPGLVDNLFNVTRFWKLHKYLQKNRWLHVWLKREIQALRQEEDVDIIFHHVFGVIDSFSKRNAEKKGVSSPEAIRDNFKASVSDAARPFLSARADRFADELELFLASGFTVEAYDEVYMQRLHPDTHKEVHEPVKVHDNLSMKIPYLYIFDEDSDETD